MQIRFRGLVRLEGRRYMPHAAADHTVETKPQTRPRFHNERCEEKEEVATA